MKKQIHIHIHRPAKVRDAERWVTVHGGGGEGHPVKIDGQGNVVGGMGGKSVQLSRAASKTTQLEQPAKPQQAPQAPQAGNATPKSEPVASTAPGQAPATKTAPARKTAAKKEVPFRMVMPPGYLSPGKLQEYTRDLAKMPREHMERNVRNNTFETAAVYDAKGKTIGVISQGVKNAVTLPERLIPKMKDSTFTHNHPSNSALGLADLTTAIAADCAEMRAVGPTATYSVKRPPGGWPDVRDFKMAYSREKDILQGHYEPLVQTGKMGPQEAWHQHSHEAMARACQQLGIPYERKYE